jgi:FkbH-like protein
VTAGPLDGIRGSRPGEISLADYRTLARDLAEQAPVLEAVRLVLLSSYTTELLDAPLIVEGARYGLGVDVYHGGYGQFEQALAAGQWRASAGAAEVLVVAMRLEDLDPDISFRYHAGDRRSFQAVGEDILDRIDATVGAFRDVSGGPTLVANFAVPGPPPLSVFDAHDPDSLTHEVHALNRALAKRMTARAGQYVWDYHGLVAAQGAAAWCDPRLWALARAPVSAANQPEFARHLMRTIRGVMRPPAKCLVVDLDDTLWGGAIGDEGLRGIVLGDDHPGVAFKRFQRAILGLRDRGALLAICSSNDPDIALEAVGRHPEMLVRPDDFASIRINWRPKSENLREIAAELNIGVDSLVFFDDNPAVRAEVRDRLPEVVVVEVPSDPTLYVATLAGLPDFDAPTLTSEDRIRAHTFRAERERHTARERVGSSGDFLASLEMTAQVGRLDEMTAPRIGQLVAKTNQFNLTTRRHSQADLEAMAASGTGAVYWLRLADKYGDLGLVSVGVVSFSGSDALVDSLVLSCRAANRGVERAMMAQLARAARAAGCTHLVGEYIPTARNHVVQDLYPGLGFVPEGDVDGRRTFRLDLVLQDVESPDHIRISYPQTSQETHA